MRSNSPTAIVAKFTCVTVVTVALIAIALGAVAQKIATDEAVRNARDVTLATGRNAIEPVLADGITQMDPAAISALDKVVHKSVLSHDTVRVKVWDENGTILYSDDKNLIGETFPLGVKEKAALKNGAPTADVSDLDEPENRDERQFKKLLEVYDGVQTPKGQKVLYEAYLRYNSVDEDKSRVLKELAVPILAGLAILLIVQIPIALGLARRLERAQAEREQLMQRTVMAAEAERKHIASDLHDGVVQRLVGTSYSLSASARTAEDAQLPRVSETLNKAAADLRQAVRELRTLIVTIAPPRLHEEGLVSALEDLSSTLTDQGIAATLDVQAAPNTLSVEAESLLYRAAQEAVRNVLKHAGATEVVIVLTSASPNVARCEIKDNGSGFVPNQPALQPDPNHVGLGLLTGLVSGAGGTLTIESEIGVGTTVTVEVPTT